MMEFLERPMCFDEEKLQDNFSGNHGGTITDFYRFNDLLSALKESECILSNLLSRAKKLTPVDYNHGPEFKAYIEIIGKIKAELGCLLSSYEFLQELLRNLYKQGIITCNCYDIAQIGKGIQKLLSEISMLAWIW